MLGKIHISPWLNVAHGHTKGQTHLREGISRESRQGDANGNSIAVSLTNLFPNLLSTIDY